MSIATNNKLSFFLEKIKYFIYILIFIVTYTLVFSIINISEAKAECYAVSSTCSVLGNNYYPLTDPSQCTLKDAQKGYMPQNTICCCEASNIVSSYKPKYILIASIVAFFAILTALVFFYKKNE